ncbi:hypothetical protein ACFPN7_13730 [Amycolatopsis halotolerans]|uniref:hypothetical protein n=1 Tax=Amycolatopsis halotolerans TaxID=330083 RepID=UPI00361862BD
MKFDALNAGEFALLPAVLRPECQPVAIGAGDRFRIDRRVRPVVRSFLMFRPSAQRSHPPAVRTARGTAKRTQKLSRNAEGRGPKGAVRRSADADAALTLGQDDI